MWQKMMDMWNNKFFAPTTKVLLSKLLTQFVDSWVITFDSCLDLSATTPEKCGS